MVAVGLQDVGGAVVGAAEDGADGDRAGQQGAGLVALHLQALRDGDPLAVLVGDVLGLAVDELAGGRGQPAGGAAGLDGAQLEQDLVGQGEEGVADEDGLGGVVGLPDGVAVAALLVAVHEVVVEQREVVHELDGHGAGDARRGGRAGGLGRQQGEGGAYGLALIAVGRPPLDVDPPEVVGGDGVHGCREPGHGGTQHRRGKRPSALQQGADACGVDSWDRRCHGLSSGGRARTRPARGDARLEGSLVHTAASRRGWWCGRPSSERAAPAAFRPLRTALSMVAGQPVAVHAPAR